MIQSFRLNRRINDQSVLVLRTKLLFTRECNDPVLVACCCLFGLLLSAAQRRGNDDSSVVEGGTEAQFLISHKNRNRFQKCETAFH